MNGCPFSLWNGSYCATILQDCTVGYKVIAISILVIAYAYLQNTGSLEDFKRVRTLGAGSFGRVILCQHLGNKHFYAIKVLDKAKARHCIITVTSLTSQTIGVRK